ncbi:MAG: hypothetical protein AAGB48_12230 [Planctomycetota bacterium]
MASAIDQASWFRLPEGNLGVAQTSGSLFGQFDHANPAGQGLPTVPAGVTRLVAWAGWLDDAGVPPGDPTSGRFARTFRSWTSDGWEALADGVARWRSTMPEVRLCLRPAAGCIVSDPQACLTFLRGTEDPGVELLLDPVAMMTASMLGHAEDHLARAFESLGGEPRVAGVVLSRPVAEGDDVRPAPLEPGRGLSGVVLDLVRANVPVGKPVLVLAEQDPTALAYAPNGRSPADG